MGGDGLEAAISLLHMDHLWISEGRVMLSNTMSVMIAQNENLAGRISIRFGQAVTVSVAIIMHRGDSCIRVYQPMPDIVICAISLKWSK